MATATPEHGEPTADDDARDPESIALGEAARRLFDEGGDAARAAGDTALALKALAAAELDLARAALPRALLLAALALLALLAACLYALAVLALALQRAGLDWPWALLAATLAGLAAAALLAWRARAAFRLGRFEATRRQLQRLSGDDA